MILILLFFLFSFSSPHSTDFHTTKNIIEMTEKGSSIYVVYCVRWSSTCNTLIQHWEELRKNKEEIFGAHNISLIHIDADDDNEAVYEAGVRDYPTIILYTRDAIVTYLGSSLTYDGLLGFINRTSVSPSLPISHDSNLYGRQKISVVYEGNMENSDQAYISFKQLSIMNYNQDVGFFHVSEGEGPGKIRIHTMDSGVVSYEGEVTVDGLLTFFKFHSSPNVVVCSNHRAMTPIADGTATGFLMFYAEDEDHRLKEFMQLSKTRPNGVLFALCDVRNEDVREIYSTLFDFETYPSYAFIKLETEGYLKYPLDIKSQVDITEALSLYTDGRLQPHYRSEPEPKDGGETQQRMRKVVGSNMMDIVRNPRHHYLVLLTSNNQCEHCRRVWDEVDRVAKKYERDTRIVFCHIDVSLNEVPRLIVNEVPSVVLFVKGKRKGAIYFQKRITENNIQAFINQHTDI